ncbi:MAG TPA: hypothetical protein VM425_04720 [Myxococcota bacterium]|nr:hypothetical protein [Myxococcota bacterium]
MNSEAGSLLVEGGRITEDQLQIVLGSVVQYGGSVIQNIVRLGLLADDELATFLADRLKVPMAEVEQFENLPAFLTRMISADLVLSHRAVPIMLHKGVLHVAMADPTDRAGLEEIAFATGYQVSPVIASYQLIENAMARYYGIPPEDEKLPCPDTLLSQAGKTEHVEPPEDADRLDEGAGAFEKGPWSRSNAALSDPIEPHGLPEQPPESRPTAGALQIVDRGSSDLEELFFGLGREDRGVIHLTRVKDTGVGPTASTITDALLGQAEGSGFAPAQAELINVMKPLFSADEARNIISRAKDRDEVARGLVRFALAYLPRAALFIVKKDILVGWMGGGEDIYPNLIKGIMIPMNSPSVFRTVRETGTDYFGSLPRTTVNDIFISTLGDVRPRRVLLVPVTVRHKPICILYGDCGQEPGFAKDLSPIHLLVGDVSNSFERIILNKKMGRRIVR